MLECAPIAAFSDNYIWLLSRPGGAEAWVVDPGDATPVLAALQQRQLQLAGILVTHHHPDHVGGVRQLLARGEVPVYGPANSPADCVSERLAEGDQVEVLGVRFEVLEVPGHTLDHIAYFGAEAEETPMLFCGDTLFAGGCGRVFEGTYEMMHGSLAKLAALPAATRVFCAHEYTLSNLAFARAVEPGNDELQRRSELDQSLRQQDRPTVPSTLGMELATNPFLRCDDSSVIAAAARQAGSQVDAGAATFAAIRAWKDRF